MESLLHLYFPLFIFLFSPSWGGVKSQHLLVSDLGVAENRSRGSDGEREGMVEEKERSPARDATIFSGLATSRKSLLFSVRFLLAHNFINIISFRFFFFISLKSKLQLKMVSSAFVPFLKGLEI